MSENKCGIPAGISGGNVWHEGGFISGRYPPYIRGTFFDVDEINHLFQTLCSYLGYDIDDILAGGKYHDTKQYMAGMIGRVGESSGGKLPPAETLYRMMLYPTRVWGISEAEILSAEPGKKVVRSRNPYSIPLFCGDIAAVVDAVEGGESKAQWEGSEEEGIITVMPSDAYSRVNGRLREEMPQEELPVGEELECERCADCGAPAEVDKLFRWEEEQAMIFERETGRRYCFNNTNGIAGVLRLLVAELGEEVQEKMAEIVRDHARALYQGLEGGMDPTRELGSFPYRGWGRAKASPGAGGEIAVEVENPYSNVLLTGRIWGLNEVARGGSLRLADRSEGDNLLQLVFVPS